ncbi:MAG: hypothetical protein AB3N33_06510 [Puniceicoccaceae bacterium]
MRKHLEKLALTTPALFVAALLSADVIITEVADGTYTGQQPKFVEITNVGTEAYTFPVGGGIINQNNANVDFDVDWDLEGLTLQPGQSWVVNSLTPSGAESASFVLMFGEDADEYADVPFGNGDDRYILTDGSTFLDIYGENGVDATPEGSSGPTAVWGYQDGYAYRKAGITTGRGLDFNPDEWVFGGVDSLEAETDEAKIALAKSVLTPGSYDSGIGGNTWAGYPVDEFGNVDTMLWMGYLNVASGDWVWTYSLSKYIYLPENFVSQSGAWSYFPAN